MSPLGTQPSYSRASCTSECHQCLSAMSPLGTFALRGVTFPQSKSPMPFGNESAWDNGNTLELTQCNPRSPMPFGNESAWDALSAPQTLNSESASPMPFGNESAWDSKPNQTNDHDNESPMPFGNESAWDVFIKQWVAFGVTSHQCLSAMSPLGT